MATADAPSLEVGAKVEVASGFDGSWQRGFVIAEVTESGYVLRREVDGSTLPELPTDRVRRERKRETWWV
jgi:hypothetical protein